MMCYDRALYSCDPFQKRNKRRNLKRESQRCSQAALECKTALRSGQEDNLKSRTDHVVQGPATLPHTHTQKRNGLNTQVHTHTSDVLADARADGVCDGADEEGKKGACGRLNEKARPTRHFCTVLMDVHVCTRVVVPYHTGCCSRPDARHVRLVYVVSKFQQ